jgi:hypothetical protein
VIRILRTADWHIGQTLRGSRANMSTAKFSGGLKRSSLSARSMRSSSQDLSAAAMDLSFAGLFPPATGRVG